MDLAPIVRGAGPSVPALPPLAVSQSSDCAALNEGGGRGGTVLMKRY